jgi:hypothetical protein
MVTAFTPKEASISFSMASKPSTTGRKKEGGLPG